MLRPLRLLRSSCSWVAAILLALLPIIVAADFGGVLWWTQYMASLAVLVAVVLAVSGIFSEENTGLVQQHILLLPLFLWIAFAWFQTVPMMPGFVSTLSNGSHTAYTEGIEPFLSSDAFPSHFPISIAVEQSRHSAAMLMLVAGLVWASSVVFLTRQRIGMLLSVIALGAAAHSAYGLFRAVNPDTVVWGTEISKSSFGFFVNRNNAALMLNLGLAASLGLLSWRLTAMTGQEVDDPSFEFNDLFALVSDSESVIGVFSAAVCMAGLLVCGSRGGLVACAAGLLLAFGWVRQSRGLRSIPVVAATVGLCVALLVVPLSLNLESIKRLEVFSSKDFTTVLRDGRLNHWQDGWQTAVAHLPAGSGLGTYAYAYLPHQQLSSGSWFQHADNLWLELFVEQGILGVTLAVSLLLIWIRALRRTNESVDPIDQGLRVCGWYMIGALAMSQLFDFGLIIPANLFIVAIFVSVQVARGVIAGTSGGSITFRSSRDTLACYSVGALAVVLTVIAVWRLNRDAQIETIARSTSATLELPGVAFEEQSLAELASMIQDSPYSSTSPILLDASCQVQSKQARLSELAAADPKNRDEFLAAYNETGFAQRRMKWRAAQEVGDQPPMMDRSESLYGQVLAATENSLRRLPLGMEARSWQVYLDFIHQDEQRTREALSQMHRFYRHNPETLVLLGSYAADSGENELAIELWRTALEVAPRWTAKVIEAVAAYSAIDLIDVLPSDPIVFRNVGNHLIRTAQKNDKLMARALHEIACDQCKSKGEKSRCQQLGGDLAFSLGQYEQAFEYYKLAINLTPTDAQLHLKYIRHLRDQDHRREALAAARRARLLIPDDLRFTNVIKQMAAQDLEEIGAKK